MQFESLKREALRKAEAHGTPMGNHPQVIEVTLFQGNNAGLTPHFFIVGLYDLYIRDIPRYIYIGDIWLDYPILSYYMP